MQRLKWSSLAAKPVQLSRCSKTARAAVRAAWQQASALRRPVRALVVASLSNQLLLVDPFTGLTRLDAHVALAAPPRAPMHS